MKETETAEDVSQNKSDENITKIFKKLMKIKRVPRQMLGEVCSDDCVVRIRMDDVIVGSPSSGNPHDSTPRWQNTLEQSM